MDKLHDGFCELWGAFSDKYKVVNYVLRLCVSVDRRAVAYILYS